MEVPYTKEEIIQAIRLTLRENRLEAAYIRPLLFYSYGNLGLVPKYCPIELIIGTWEWGAYLGEKASNGVSVYILPWKRVHYSQLDMTAKLGGAYIQSTICGLEARARGFDEAVFLNIEGNVAEGPGENIFIYKNGILKTNDKTESVLEGITRTSLLKIAKENGIKTEVGPIEKEEFSGTAVEVVSITNIVDGSNPKVKPKRFTVGAGKPGPVTNQLRNIYLDIVSGKVKKYKRWLTYVND
jgi:branched-chain amino acid aminotransferase